MPGKQVTFGNTDKAAWLDVNAVGEVVWRDGIAYRVLGIYFSRDPESRDDRLCQWWIGEELQSCDVPR